jgi:ABC-type nitrate/sulfonate/bicarbonate transport system substrate-binding protein
LKKQIINNTEKIEDIDKKIEDILKETKESLQKIKDNEEIEDIVKTIYEDKNQKEKYSINQIIKAYEEIKGDEDDKKPTKDEVLVKLKESE